jgi:hypothetical protein
MKLAARAAGLSIALLFASACKEQQSDKDAIRAGITQHLAGVGTLNMSAMDMDIRIVSINGNEAHAEVEFRPKTGAPPGAGMQVGYNLEKRDSAWVVLKSQPAGGVIEHPELGQDPHQNQNVHSGALPNIRDMFNPAGTSAPGALPPGHPPVKPQTSKQDQTPPQESR